MAVLWFGPFYVVAMWTVVSSFMGNTWSDRNSYSNYLDNADITTGQGLKNQEQLRQGSTRKEKPCKHDGRYIYDRMSKESQSRNSDPGVLLTNFWSSQVPEDSFYRRDGETDSNLSQESWFNPDFKISSDSLTKQKMQQDNYDDEADVNGLVRLGRGSLKRVAEKRQGHSLSIVNPLDVLRHRLMLDLAERRMKENQNQIKANDAILKIIGKRKKRTLARGSETKEGRIAMRKRQAVDYFDWPQNSATSNIEA